MLAHELVVGKVYKTFSYETARAIVEEVGLRSFPDTIHGISKQRWDESLYEVQIHRFPIDPYYVWVRGNNGQIFKIPCCTIREEAQF